MSDRKPRKWEVSRMYGGWEAVHPSSERVAFFRTFAEAIAYADQQARTVSIHVPPVGRVCDLTNHVGWHLEVVESPFGPDTTIRHGSRSMTIPESLRLPLARVLLAHHGKSQANG